MLVLTVAKPVGYGKMPLQVHIGRNFAKQKDDDKQDQRLSKLRAFANQMVDSVYWHKMNGDSTR